MRDAQCFLIRLVAAAAFDQRRLVAVAGLNLSGRIENICHSENPVRKYVDYYGAVYFAIFDAPLVRIPLVFFCENIAESVVCERPVFYLYAGPAPALRRYEQIIRAVAVCIFDDRAGFLEKIFYEFPAVQIDILPVFFCHFIIHIFLLSFCSAVYSALHYYLLRAIYKYAR